MHAFEVGLDSASDEEMAERVCRGSSGRYRGSSESGATTSWGMGPLAAAAPVAHVALCVLSCTRDMGSGEARPWQK